MKIILACDRSGGHIFPAQCILNNAGREEIYLFAPSLYLKLFFPNFKKKIYGKHLGFRNIFVEVFFRFWEALYLIFKIRPKRVIGFGGRDTFFLLLLSRLFFIDVDIYEPNVLMGRANAILSFFSRYVYRGFGVKKLRDKEKNIGIPIRDSLIKIDKTVAKRKLGFDSNIPVVLCFGGSQGSEFINDVFMRLVKDFGEKFQIIHITGSKQYSEIIKFYDTIKANAQVFDFYPNMEVAYSCADLVVARGGALTIAEVLYYGIKAIFIPYPKAGAHQYENVNFVYSLGGCRLIDQRDFSFDIFKAEFFSLLENDVLSKNFKKSTENIKLAISSAEFANAIIKNE